MLNVNLQRFTGGIDEGPCVANGLFAIARISLAIGVGVALVAVNFQGSEERFEDFALGEDTAALYGNYGGNSVHCATVVTAQACLEPARKRGLAQTIIWLGNSQLHAINQPGPGAKTAPVMLAERLRPRGIEVLGFSQPNASLQEHRLLFEYLLAHIQPDTLVLPVVFDDSREDHIRAEIRVASEDPAVRAGLAGTPLGERLNVVKQVDAQVAENSEKMTLQERVEAALEDYLSSTNRAWAARPQARGWIATRLYLVRNSLLGIKATNKRRIIPGIYRRNMAAFADLLRRAHEAEVKVFVYVVPLRNDVEPPYVMSEYAAFKDEVIALAADHGATFANLEKLVPADKWGAKASTNIGGAQEIDFMHFQFGGHILLEHAIAGQLGGAGA